MVNFKQHLPGVSVVISVSNVTTAHHVKLQLLFTCLHWQC